MPALPRRGRCLLPGVACHVTQRGVDRRETFSADGSATASYVYDAGGLRVRRTTTAGSVDLLYDLQGRVVTEVSSGGAWNRGEIFAGGGHLATYRFNSTYFNHVDWLGTERLRTDVHGATSETCTSLSFGDWLSCIGQGDPSPNHFTGKERDTESGLDNFGARYFGSSLGRFMTPDEFWKDSDVGDPQSWNKYAYARNNPLRYTDPTGEEATVTSSCNQDHTTCQVNVTAGIAIYAVNGTTADQMKQAQSAITSQIDQAWSGSFTQDGTTYNVSTNVTVSIASSENAGAQSGAQNVIGIDASGNATSHIDPNNFGRSYDKGVWDFSSVTSGQLAPHEFSHVLGLDDNHGNVLSNSFSSASMGKHPHATAQDYQWAFGSELKAGKTRFNVGDYEGKTIFTGINRGNKHWWEGWTNPQVDHK